MILNTKPREVEALKRMCRDAEQTEGTQGWVPIPGDPQVIKIKMVMTGP